MLQDGLDTDPANTTTGAETDGFTIFVAPGIDTVHGPVVVSDLAPNESVHIIVAEATEDDAVTARLAPNGKDTEVIYRAEVVAVLKNINRLRPNQVIFAPMTLKPSAPETPEATPDVFTWNGFDRSSLRQKPIIVPDYIPGLDRLEANLGFGPLKPKVQIEDTGEGDTFVRVNGKALFRLQGVAPNEITPEDVQVTRL